MTPAQPKTVFHAPTATRVRPAPDGDAGPIRAVVFGVLAEFGLAADPGSYDADLFDIDGSYFARGGWFEVAEAVDGRIVGTAGLVPKGDGVVELKKMYLRSEVRGRGLGRLLLERAVERARRMGCRRVVLDTSTRLTEAARLYTGHGFVRVPHGSEAERCDAAYALDLT